jgi:linoleoyl-CoA desaturase
MEKEKIRIRYGSTQRQFLSTLHSRVEEYFKTAGKKKTGGTSIVLKTVFMFALYLTPFILLLTGVIANAWLMLGMCVVMGIGMAGVGLSVMHDANHGSYSGNRKLNQFMSYSMNVVGGHYMNWQIQHNTLHHTFTNIEGHDEDIAPVGFLRFSPHAPYRKIHRYQFIYAWFFYGLMTLMWVATKDFNQLKRYNQGGLLKTARTTYAKQLVILITSKVLYYALMIVLPLLVMHITWWQFLIGFFALHFTCGLILALIFQPAHVIEETDFPLPDKTGHIENDWAVHQLYTTANFAPRNWLLFWFVGGLNYQVEHHLFPAVSHIHYKRIAPIVEQTAKEFNYPYISKRSFFSAIASHTRVLRQFGKA